jgi:hypothetical protein
MHPVRSVASLVGLSLNSICLSASSNWSSFVPASAASSCRSGQVLFNLSNASMTYIFYPGPQIEHLLSFDLAIAMEVTKFWPTGLRRNP